MKRSSIHPAEVLTSALIIAATFAVASLAHSQTVETFKEFHIPAKHIIDTGQEWLFNGAVVNGEVVHMNPHIAFGATGEPLLLVGAQPPLTHDAGIRTGSLWIFFDQPVSSVSFGALPDDEIGYLYVGAITNPYDNSGVQLYVDGLLRSEGYTRVECNVGMPIYGLVMYWLNALIDGTEGSYSNVQIP